MSVPRSRDRALVVVGIIYGFLRADGLFNLRLARLKLDHESVEQTQTLQLLAESLALTLNIARACAARRVLVHQATGDIGRSHAEIPAMRARWAADRFVRAINPTTLDDANTDPARCYRGAREFPAEVCELRPSVAVGSSFQHRYLGPSLPPHSTETTTSKLNSINFRAPGLFRCSCLRSVDAAWLFCNWPMAPPADAVAAPLHHTAPINSY
jgi:hypothetical protein